MKQKTTGKLKAYKKCIQYTSSSQEKPTEYLVELEIPAEAKRVFPQGPSEKGRAEFAIVKRIWRHKRAKGRFCGWVEVKTKGYRLRHVGIGGWGLPLVYILREKVTPNYYDGSESRDCSSGINFFLDIQQAKDYPRG